MELLVEVLGGSEAEAIEILSASEIERSRRFTKVRDRQRYVLARATLRRALAARLAVRPASLQFYLTDRGKPCVAGLHFNVSHADGLLAIAISSKYAVGVDIEKVTPLNAKAIAWGYFSRSEAHLVAAAVDPIDAFFRIWTRKEAALKAHGLGIVDTLSEVPPAQIWDFTPAPGYQGAVASLAGEADAPVFVASGDRSA